MTNDIKNQDRKYRPLVYVASAYSGNVTTNTEKAKQYCRFAMEQGQIPLAPHLMFPQFMDDDIPSERKDAMDMAKDILRRCRVLVVCGKEISDGMMQEIALAKHLGIVQTNLEGIEKVDECVQSESDDED